MTTTFQSDLRILQTQPSRAVQTPLASSTVTAITGSEASGNNTSSVALSGGAQFIGTGEQNDYPDVMVSCQTDAAGTLYFDFSINGIDWTTFPVEGFKIKAGIHEFHSAVKGPRFFRVRLVNGSAAQTYLRLTTYFGAFRQGNLPVNSGISSDADALVVRSISSDLDLAIGRVEGQTEDAKFGSASGLGSAVTIATPSTWVDLWEPGIQRTIPSGTFTPHIASSDAGDTSLDVAVTYLDADGLEQTTTVTTDAANGQTGVSLGVTASEVTRAFTVDEFAGNVSILTANNFTSGAATDLSELLAYIQAGDGQTQQLMSRVPSNVTRVFRDHCLEILRDNGAAGSVIAVLETQEGNDAPRVRRKFLITSSQKSDGPLKGVVLQGGTNYRIRIRDVSDNNTFISGWLDFFDVEN